MSLEEGVIQKKDSMNIMSFNISGCGSMIKKRRLQHHLRTNNIDICLIQETKA